MSRVVDSTYLLSVTSSGYIIPNTNTTYTGPSEEIPCLCTTVEYSLFSACSSCQGVLGWIRYLFYFTDGKIEPVPMTSHQLVKLGDILYRRVSVFSVYVVRFHFRCRSHTPPSRPYLTHW